MLSSSIILTSHVVVAAIIVFAKDSSVTSVGYAIVAVGSRIVIFAESGAIAQETVIVDVTVGGMGSTSGSLHGPHYLYIWQT